MNSSSIEGMTQGDLDKIGLLGIYTVSAIGLGT